MWTMQQAWHLVLFRSCLMRPNYHWFRRSAKSLQRYGSDRNHNNLCINLRSLWHDYHDKSALFLDLVRTKKFVLGKLEKPERRMENNRSEWGQCPVACVTSLRCYTRNKWTFLFLFLSFAWSLSMCPVTQVWCLQKLRWIDTTSFFGIKPKRKLTRQGYRNMAISLMRTLYI